jgi:hypothetical protein
VIYRLISMQEFELVLEAEAGAFRTNFFASLENLNKFARLNQVERTLLWIRYVLEDTMDSMCRFTAISEMYEY